MSALVTIYASPDFVTTSMVDDANMFLDDIKLVGGSNTLYSASRKTSDYAHIDGGISNPGYFTISPNYVVHNNSVLLVGQTGLLVECGAYISRTCNSAELDLVDGDLFYRCYDVPFNTSVAFAIFTGNKYYTSSKYDVAIYDYYSGNWLQSATVNSSSIYPTENYYKLENFEFNTAGTTTCFTGS